MNKMIIILIKSNNISCLPVLDRNGVPYLDVLSHHEVQINRDFVLVEPSQV